MVSPHPSSCPCVTLLTDFGTRDTYVGQMKGAAISVNPLVQLVDLTHEVPPRQILRGAFIWSDAIAAFPVETIHVAVVDPGVGSERRLIAAEIGERRFVCPDNGLLSVILQQATLRRGVSLDDRRWWRSSVTNTFHGRDILSPVAAAWSLGHDLGEFGSPLSSPLITLPLAAVTRGRASLSGVIVDVDRFGNLITNIDEQNLPQRAGSMHVELGLIRISGVSRCYADVSPGEPVALAGSSGRLEIAIRDGSAAEELQAGCGRSVVVRWTGGSE
jgi:S-adenosylmethionine hydrolase